MTLSTKKPEYIIPAYSLTGDLLAFLTCGLQYRYYNKGKLPPSTPVQLWFGSFIHAVMEEAYLMWREGGWKHFPWEWQEKLREIELKIDKRLNVEHMYAPPNLFCIFDGPEKVLRRGCPDTKHPHKLLASQRADLAINTWGKHLFPLISEAEVMLQGLKKMPAVTSRKSRSDYYEMTGVVDVLGSVNLQDPENSGNLILHYLQDLQSISSEDFEIIVDYKGMRRPAVDSYEWKWHEWQILTYAHLRQLQEAAQPVVAGILLYLNELAPSKRDMDDLRRELARDKTDVVPKYDIDRATIERLKKPSMPNTVTEEEPTPAHELSTTYRAQRSIRVIPVTTENINRSLNEFNDVVKNIEGCVADEIHGQAIIETWKGHGKPSARRCGACDFKTVCPVLRAAMEKAEVKGVATAPTAP